MFLQGDDSTSEKMRHCSVFGGPVFGWRIPLKTKRILNKSLRYHFYTTSVKLREVVNDVF